MFQPGCKRSMALKLIAQVPVTIVICSLLTHLLSAQELPGSINTVNVRRAEDFKADGLSAYWIDLSLVVENRGAVRAFIPDQGGFVSHIAQKTVSADKTDLWKSVYHASRLDTSGLQYRPCVALEPKETRVIRDIQAKLVLQEAEG